MLVFEAHEVVPSPVLQGRPLAARDESSFKNWLADNTLNPTGRQIPEEGEKERWLWHLCISPGTGVSSGFVIMCEDRRRDK